MQPFQVFWKFIPNRLWLVAKESLLQELQSKSHNVRHSVNLWRAWEQMHGFNVYPKKYKETYMIYHCFVRFFWVAVDCAEPTIAFLRDHAFCRLTGMMSFWPMGATFPLCYRTFMVDMNDYCIYTLHWYIQYLYTCQFSLLFHLSVCLSVRPSVCLCVCVSVCLCVCLPVCLSIYLSI